ncbi:MAG: hypothetical protein JNM25_01055 [Planctomycetes bacterium]|nr:hypothetical protein [Planctomycetota bacterium]
MNHRNPTVPAALLSIVLGACSSAPPYAAMAIEDDAEATSNVVVTDGELHDIVRVGQAFVERVPGTNQLRVTVPIRNIDDETIQILAQMSFLNGRKQPIGDDTNRQVKILAPGDTITYVAISKQAEAADWTLRLGWNR